MPRPSRPSVPSRLALLLFLCALCALTASSQFNKAPTVAESNPAMGFNDGNPRDDPNRYAHRQMLEKIFIQRQREMSDASDRILRLATDINAEVNHPSAQPNPDPGDSLRKAETIAKLAHAIRQHMASNDIH